METRYTVRQATDATGVKSYVLRYWEDELGLNIHRNELGHRYYTGYDIQLFLNIKELKKKGLQLRAIRDMIPQMELSVPEFLAEGQKLPEGASAEGENSQQDGACRISGACAEEPEKKLPEEAPQDGKILEFQAILERLITQELQSKNEDEERCRSLDLAIRRQQVARREAAAANEKKNGRRRRGQG